MKEFYDGCLLTIFLGVGLLPALCSAQSVNVTTWHNDNWRTGQNTSEITLTTGINDNSFGRICSYPVSGQVYAQPLVLASIMIGGTLHEAVYVVTMQDKIYVFDGANHNGTSCTLLQGPFSLIPSNEAPVDCSLVSQCGIIAPTIGILGTPVIDASTNTLYVVTESQDRTQTIFYHRLHALDLTSSTLAEKNNGPATIPSATVGKVQFNPKNEIQRPGLLFLNYNPGADPVPPPNVYIAFSMMDGASPNPSGWVFAYDGGNLALVLYPLAFATVQNSDTNKRFGGGIWQGGGGLAAGLDVGQLYYIYVSTADGQFGVSSSNYGDSFLKLNTDLQLVDYFTPSDAFYRWDISCGPNDKDFGSGGVTLLPDGVPTSSAYLAVKGDKEGGIWVIDRTSPSGYGGPCNPTCGQCTTDHNVQTLRPTVNGYHALFHNNPAYWNDFLYFAGAQTDAPKGNILPLTRFPLCPSTTSPICATSKPSLVQFTYGTTPSVSSNGNSNGIVWAVDSDGSAQGGAAAVLHAFDAASANMTEIYNSNQCGTADQPGPATKFSVPTIANGRVFIGTQTDFDIYGTLQRTC